MEGVDKRDYGKRREQRARAKARKDQASARRRAGRATAKRSVDDSEPARRLQVLPARRMRRVALGLNLRACSSFRRHRSPRQRQARIPRAGGGGMRLLGANGLAERRVSWADSFSAGYTAVFPRADSISSAQEFIAGSIFYRVQGFVGRFIFCRVQGFVG